MANLSLDFIGVVTRKTIISKNQLDKIANELLTNWEELSYCLELTQQQESDIRRTYREYADQKREALRAWKRNKGNGATFGALIDAAKEASNMQLAHDIIDLMETLQGKNTCTNISVPFKRGRNPPTTKGGGNDELLK